MDTAMETMALHEGLGEGMKVQVSKVIRARRARVFEAWTKPEVVKQWFGPAGMFCTSAEVDARVGGAYEIRMESAETGKVSEAHGIYEEVVPNERLRFTWQGCWRPGEESVVTVSLHDVEGGTEVTILHERVHAIEALKGYEMGWTGSLEKLAGAFGE